MWSQFLKRKLWPLDNGLIETKPTNHAKISNMMFTYRASSHSTGYELVVLYLTCSKLVGNFVLVSNLICLCSLRIQLKIRGCDITFKDIKCMNEAGNRRSCTIRNLTIDLTLWTSISLLIRIARIEWKKRSNWSLYEVRSCALGYDNYQHVHASTIYIIDT